jgi:hypothetical protein
VRLELGYFFLAAVLTVLQLVADFRFFYFFAIVSPTLFLTLSAPFLVLVLEIILPFVLMYLVSTRISWTQVRSILTATFLGCLVGGVINTVVNAGPGLETYFGPISNISPWLMFQAVSGWFVTEVFSRVLFASFAAILFAYYYKHPDRTPQQPARAL